MNSDKIKPLGDRVLVKPVDAAKTFGVLYIPKGAQEQSLEAKVIAVGPKAKGVQPGEQVLVSKYSGTELKIDGKVYKIFSIDDIVAVIG